MAQDLKETLISTMVNGKEVIQERYDARKSGDDLKISRGRVDSIVAKYHPASMKLRIIEILDETTEAKTFRFVSDSKQALPVFQAGQFINIFMNINGVLTSRPYSISSSPKQLGYVEITIAKTKNGFAADYMLNEAKVGDVFEANGPSGGLTYNPVFHKKNSVFLAGGSGVTPFVSMARELAQMGSDRSVYMIFGARNEKVAIFHKELEHLASVNPHFHYNLVISDDVAAIKYKKGFIDSNLIKSIVPDVNDCTYYMCGPSIMTDFCYTALKELGIPDRRIVREVFGSRQDIQNEAGYPSGLTGKEVYKINVAGKVIDASANESVMQALERAGIRVRVCCRSGICSLCRVKKISGKVFLPRGVNMRYADVKYDYIYSCKTYPISDLEIQLQ